MKRKIRLHRVCKALVLSGVVFSGPCGITSLQFRDFLTSTLIRTTTSSLSAIVEAAVVQSAQNPQTTAP